MRFERIIPLSCVSLIFPDGGSNSLHYIIRSLKIHELVCKPESSLCIHKNIKSGDKNAPGFLKSGGELAVDEQLQESTKNRALRLMRELMETCKV